MGRVYAAILALTAFLASLARGWAGGSPPRAVLWEAWLAMVAFAMVGWISGWVAGWIVDDAVRRRLADQLAANQASNSRTRKQANP